MQVSQNQFLKKTLCIDVGDHTGYAFWDKPRVNPETHGQFSLSKHGLLHEDIAEMTGLFEEMVDDHVDEYECIDLCIIEGVEIWEGSLRSQTSAKRGNLFKLAYLVGSYSSICLQRKIPFRIVPARAWKGQMKNEMVCMRVERITGIHLKKSYQHEIDAIGIGLSTMGYFERTVRNPQRVKRFKIHDQT